MTEISKIEEAIKKRLLNEVEQQKADLKERYESDLLHAIECIDNVYATAIDTLKKLELTDATLFDFYLRANCDVRVYPGVNGHRDKLHLSLAGMSLGDYEEEIRLEDKKYKIIVIAIEETKEAKP